MDFKKRGEKDMPLIFKIQNIYYINEIRESSFIFLAWISKINSDVTLNDYLLLQKINHYFRLTKTSSSFEDCR